MNVLRRPVRRRTKAKPWRRWKNVGLWVDRILYQPPKEWVHKHPYTNKERVFAERWEDTNKPQRGLNHGHGTLQDLMFARSSEGDSGVWPLSAGRVIYEITPRERAIVATVVQWLGTNCGWSWLGGIPPRLRLPAREDQGGLSGSSAGS